tara:strand:+ start:14453 stop:15727 length:1275 start_codon:yes stop_codon:yes gene_type:complete
MEGIYNTDSSFDFTKLKLAKPQQIPGGNYFIRLSIDDKALYIQPPKSKTKQGFLKAGKRYYTDLMFSNEDTNFIEWMENLENYCQKMLYQYRDQWFEDSMEIHEIENYFTSPLRIFKSGKFYIARVNVNTNLGKPLLKIYDEDENLISMDQVNEKVNIMSILEIKGIKCSATSFQIEMEIKQMMILKPENLFEKCLFKTNSVITLKKEDTINDSDNFSNHNDVNVSIEDNTKQELDISQNANSLITDTITNNSNDDQVIIEDVEDSEEDSVKENEDNENNIKEEAEKVELNTLDNDNNIEHPENTLEGLENNITNNDSIEETEKSLVEDQKDLENHQEKEVSELQEVNLSLDEIPEQNSISIKNKDNVYYQMYKEAKTKAKVARDLAISSYLESKRIKNLYMLDNTSDTDDSDFENIVEESENI